MVGINIRLQQTNFIKHLQDQGILDNNFNNFLSLRIENPGLVVEVIAGFMHNTDTTISELNDQLHADDLDFAKVGHYVHQLKGSSASIGGYRMVLEVLGLRDGCYEGDRNKCFEAFEKVKEEYQILKENLVIISELEQTLMANVAARRARA
ncbi:hypothetical protein Tsubulata_051169 [Turnera subulata]|uniref:Histidine-containing phosphotransfer protein n=1 Tax=Turnera subulata TaxID=218843 RepID=A0A9Q0FLZ5_9ROSI|nr:hypothetical protein Tsubulata_051169 [Turnera subulata]